MVSKSQPIHQLFEDCQKALKEKSVLSLKRIDTVRWSAREFALDIFVKRYDAIIEVLQKIVSNVGRSYKAEKRTTADGMLKLFSTKQFLATAYLFKEIFSITGPLSRKLQGTNIDFGSALTILTEAENQLTTLRRNHQVIIDNVESEFEGVEWEQKRTPRKRKPAPEIVQGGDSEPEETVESTPTAQDKWRIDVFNVALDQVTSSLKDRFSDSKHVLEAFTIFSPRSFPNFFQIYPATIHVEAKVRKFCQTYEIDSYRCASELFSFAKAFEKFNLDVIETKAYVTDDLADDTDTDVEPEDDVDVTKNTFIDCLSILTNSTYKLIDAYPTLVRVYSIAVAIPITSCSAERSFSTLKRIKTRLRSSMLQERLEGLMLMSTERKILIELDRDNIIDLLGKSSPELSKALIW
ncbi:zinc finger MYM-type protein 1-like [Clytia hemisphaerica]|uniref:zinc finger MYM-type protein 1-like n=1 Tax=Clytia hemisphaerica TaxID=252671 RepID=UPI0034D4A748